jgi:hypothetical protein
MRSFTDALHSALDRLGADRRAALRSLVTTPPAARSSIESRDRLALAATDPQSSSVMPAPLPSSARAPAHLKQTEPLATSLPFAVTAPVNIADTDDAATLPTIHRSSLPLKPAATRVDPRPAATIKMEAVPARIATPQPSAPVVPVVPVVLAAPPAPAPVRRNRAALVVVIVALVVGAAGGAWLVLRVIPWPF